MIDDRQSASGREREISRGREQSDAYLLAMVSPGDFIPDQLVLTCLPGASLSSLNTPVLRI